MWDAWSFFKLLDLDAGGSVEIEEFFKGCLRRTDHQPWQSCMEFDTRHCRHNQSLVSLVLTVGQPQKITLVCLHWLSLMAIWSTSLLKMRLKKVGFPYKLMDRLRGQARGVDLGKLLHDQRWLIKAQGRFQSYMEVGVTGWRSGGPVGWQLAIFRLLVVGLMPWLAEACFFCGMLMQVYSVSYWLYVVMQVFDVIEQPANSDRQRVKRVTCIELFIDWLVKTMIKVQCTNFDNSRNFVLNIGGSWQTIYELRKRQKFVTPHRLFSIIITIIIHKNMYFTKPCCVAIFMKV